MVLHHQHEHLACVDTFLGTAYIMFATHDQYQALYTQVDIISIDKSYNKGNKVMDPNYNPKVSTWGVFERPANISEAYGGGRTIRAGTPLEDAAVTQARKERMAAALSRCSNVVLILTAVVWAITALHD